MKKGNGISLVAAVLATVPVAAACVVFFSAGHKFWGSVFALITLDFFADVVLSCKSAKGAA